MPFTKSLLALAASSLFFTSPAQAHSWVEQLMVIAPNGTFTGDPGYVRGQVVRDINFSDTSMTNLIPPNGRSTGNEVLSTDLMCKSSQTVGNYSTEFPMLSASAGDHVALRYQENGHVTQPNLPPGKPANSGTVYIYGTTQPRDNDTFLSIHKVWNAEGTGGDGRGVLLATRNFDDGQCYQVNTSPKSLLRQNEFVHTADALMGVNLWCQTDVQIPANITNANTYSLYWVWDWPTANGTAGAPDGKNETYTTCMDIQLSSNITAGPSRQAVSFVKGQNLNNAAIASQLTAQFDVTGTATANSLGTPSTSAAVSTKTKTSAAGVTVTVTEAASIQYVTVTETVTAGAEAQTSTVRPSPEATSTTSSISTSASAGGVSVNAAAPTETVITLSPAASASPTSTSAASLGSSTSTVSHVSVPSYSTLRVPTTVIPINTAAMTSFPPLSSTTTVAQRRAAYSLAPVPRIRGRAPRQ